MRRITPEELAQHKSRASCWSAFNGRVYNMTPYLGYHPGGAAELMRVAGKDGQSALVQLHHPNDADCFTCVTLQAQTCSVSLHRLFSSPAWYAISPSSPCAAQ